MVDRGSFTQQEIQFLDERITIKGRVIPKRLPKDFVPGNWTIICGRGKECYNHIGNRRLRILVEVNLAKYSATKSKFQKTLIVSSIVDAVRTASPVGGFVKQQPKTKTFVEIGDDVARERVGQLFRESLTRKNPAKLNARKEKRRAQARKNKAREEKRGSLASAKSESNSSAASVAEESVDMASSVAASTSASVSASDSSVAESTYTALSVTPEPTPLSPSVTKKHMQNSQRKVSFSCNPVADTTGTMFSVNPPPAGLPGTSPFVKHHFNGATDTTLAASVSPSPSPAPAAFNARQKDFCLATDLFDDSHPLPLQGNEANAMVNPNPFSFLTLLGQCDESSVSHSWHTPKDPIEG